MKLYILRHGRAEPYIADDASRELVAHGRREVAQVVEASLGEMRQLKEIWVSPYVRALQTAQIVAGYLGLHPQSCNLLLPETDPDLLITALKKSSCDSLLLVSHQPLVSRLVDTLCGCAAGTHGMDTAALASVDLDLSAVTAGHLRWLRHPSS